MRPYFFTTLVFVFLALLFSLNRGAAQSKTEFSIETDPATFVFNGYAIHLRVKPVGMDHWLFGLGTYAMDMPEALIDLNKANKAQGWQVRLKQGYGLFAEYYFAKSNQGLFVGGQAAFQKFGLQKGGFEGVEADFYNVLFMPYAGFSWRPFKNNFYLKPWGGIGVTDKLSGSNQIGGSEYDISPVVPFVTLHLGYTF